MKLTRSELSANESREPPVFDQVWADLQRLIGDGITITTLSLQKPNSFRLVNGEINVTMTKGMGRLPREWVEAVWNRLAVGPLTEDHLPQSHGFLASVVLALFAELPYVDYTISPRATLFLRSHVFKNAELSTTFGVSPQGGIRYTGEAKNPRLIVFVTTAARESKHDHPYQDRWENGVLHYTGEGLNGDQKMGRGNLALNSSAEVDAPVFGFEKMAPDKYAYLGRFRVLGVDEEEQVDTSGSRRRVFVFRLQPNDNVSTGGASRGISQSASDHFDEDQDGTPVLIGSSERLEATLLSERTFPVAPLPRSWNWQEQMDQLIAQIAATGFVFEPWQIAAYVTALRTKPFVILAGISGTGKSRLPQLVAQACGYNCEIIPVRPDWTDSSDLLGYTDLQGRFRPGRLLELARQAGQGPDAGVVAVLDEMNLARVEHYFAEVLSRIEDRSVRAGGWRCKPLLSGLPREVHKNSERSPYADVCLPPNMAIVGTVNMDESTHGFSRKVLDRAFTLELSDVELDTWGGRVDAPQPALDWPAAAMIPHVMTLADAVNLSERDRESVTQVVRELQRLNDTLRVAQLQVGYRVRDEIALFVLNAGEVNESFVTRSGERVDPLDLAVSMKVLPRVIGGSGAIRRVLTGLLAWALARESLSDSDVDDLVREWQDAGRPARLSSKAHPLCAARVCLMLERLADDGFTSYWL